MYQSKEEKILKSKRGITLIALVISIIVLLILAGVSIAMLTGENGILKRAIDAKEQTEKATEEEQRQLTIAEATMNFENTEYTDKNGAKVIIPAGFAVSQVDGENTVEDGLVVIDSEGNSYVWIEVPKTGEIYKETNINVIEFNEDIYTKIEKDLKNYTSNYNESRKNFSDNWKENSQIDESEYNKLKKAMLKNIYVNEGFWIGRYEVGYEGEVWAPESNYFGNKIEKEPVVKEGAYPFNYICYPQAQKLANSISYGEYKGSILFGIQWDLVCKFIEVNNGKKENEIKNDSRSWGNYRNSVFDITKGKYSSDKGKKFNEVIGKYTKGEYDTGNGILLTTGATKRNSVLNIYDFAGNLWEYTLEFSNDYVDLNHPEIAVRGGAYSRDGATGGAVSYGSCSYNSYYDFRGFRTTLIPIDI